MFRSEFDIFPTHYIYTNPNSFAAPRVTGERLKMSSFTLPMGHDKTYLVIKKPGSTNSLNKQVQKVLQPFSYGLWALVIVIILVSAMLSVWFGSHSYRTQQHRTNIKVKTYLRMLVDSMIEKGIVSII